MRFRWLPALAMIAAAALFTGASSGCKKQNTVEDTAGNKLTLSVPRSVSLAPGDQEKVKIAVERSEGWNEPVKVTVENLPAGVTVVDKDVQIDRGDHDVEITLQADAKANAVKNHAVSVKAGAGTISTTEKIEVTIEEKE